MDTTKLSELTEDLDKTRRRFHELRARRLELQAEAATFRSTLDDLGEQLLAQRTDLLVRNVRPNGELRELRDSIEEQTANEAQVEEDLRAHTQAMEVLIEHESDLVRQFNVERSTVQANYRAKEVQAAQAKAKAALLELFTVEACGGTRITDWQHYLAHTVGPNELLGAAVANARERLDVVAAEMRQLDDFSPKAEAWKGAAPR